MNEPTAIPPQLSLEDFANIVKNAGEAIIIYESRKIIFVNEKACELAGLSREEFIGSNIFDYIPLESKEQIAARIAQRESGEAPRDHYEIQLVGRQGKHRDYWISSNIIQLNGRDCVLCFLTDITQQKEAAAALQKSEAKYRQLIEEAHDAILLSNVEGDFFEVNSRTSEIFGYDKEELLKMNIRELIFSKDMDLKPLRLDELAAGQNVTTQRELRRKDGTEFTAEVSGKMLPDGAIQGTVRDLSERKDAEKRLRLIVEGTSNAIGEDFLKDLAKHLATSLEIKYVLITEYRFDTVSTAFPLVLWADDHYENMPEYAISGTPCQNVWQTKQLFISQNASFQFPEDDWLQRHHIVSYIGLPLLDSHHQFIGHLAVMHDKPIDDLILAESILRIFGARAGAELERKSLEKMWRRYEFIVNSSRDLMSLVDRDYRYEAVNDAYCLAQGLPRSEVIGKTAEAIWGESTFKDVIKPHLEMCFQGEEFHEQAWIQPRSYNKQGYFDISYYPYYDHKGIVTHAIIVSRDITARKETDDKLNQLYDMQAKLFSSIAHSLKTPFSVVLGNINMLEKLFQDGNDESLELLTGIKESVFQANEKVTQLLKVAQLDMSPNHSTQEVIDLDETVARVVGQAKYLFQAYNIGISRTEIDKHVRLSSNSQAKVNADAKSISDLVLTLLDNAFKHSPLPGELPDVEVNTYREDKWAIIEIADKGKGIDAKHLAHIFDLYYQVDNNRGGFGIGLAFCKKLSEALGGAIKVESTVGKGTTFTIKLPVNK